MGALHTHIIAMKVVLALCALVAVTLAQRPPAGNHNNHNQHGNHDQHGLGGLIHHEVVALLAADPALTEDMCATKCDALFDLVRSKRTAPTTSNTNNTPGPLPLLLKLTAS